MKLHVKHPPVAVERVILRHHAQGFQPAHLETMHLTRAASAEEIQAMRNALYGVRVDDGLLEYIAEIVNKSRSHRSVYLGASPRGSIGLLAAARAQAASEGRDFVVPDDVKALAPAVLRHRIILHPDAEIEGISTDDCVEEILREAKVPRTAA
jgi:MoxR-like ATPase